MRTQTERNWTAALTFLLLASGIAVPDLALAQAASPFLTGATSLQTNILAWLTPVAVILVITSIHAGSCELAFEQLVLLVKQSAGGRELARADIKRLLYLLVDVVIQFGVERQERFIKEIYYDPERKRRSLAEAD